MCTTSTNACPSAIKRIIFESVYKFDGSAHRLIDTPSLKQIAGRAGRYRTAAQVEGLSGGPHEVATDLSKLRALRQSPSVGLVTTFERDQLPIVEAAMREELEPIMSAGLFPPTSVLTKFATYFPPLTDFSYMLLRLHEVSLMHPRYHLCNLKEQVNIADIIQPVRNLTVRDRIIFCAAPAALRVHGIPDILAAFARCVGDNTSGALLDIPQMNLDILDEDLIIDRRYMYRLESLHQALILYLWLSYRFAGVFVNQAMAFYVKKLVEERIDKLLAEYSASSEIRTRIRRMRERALFQISKLNKPNLEPLAEPIAEPNGSEDNKSTPGLDFLLEDLPAESPERQES